VIIRTCFVSLPARHWKIAIVLRIDRQQRRAAARDRRQHHVARRNQRFLVGQRHGLAALDRGHRRGQPGAADNRRHGDVGAARASLDQRVGTGRRLDTRTGQRRAQFVQAGRIGHDGHAGRKLARERRELVDLRMGGQRLDTEGIGIATDQIERRGTDRAGAPSTVIERVWSETG
jgi:hypothetical protein